MPWYHFGGADWISACGTRRDGVCSACGNGCAWGATESSADSIDFCLRFVISII